MFSTWKYSWSVLSLLMFIGCANQPGDGKFYYGTMGMGEARIVVLNADVTAPTAYTVSMYDLSGNLIRVLQDYTFTADIPRGIAPFDAFNFVVALSSSQDRLDVVDIYGNSSTWATNSQFSGTQIYQMAQDSSGAYLVIEDATIERFNSAGNRTTTGANPFITAAFAGCATNLLTPRGIAVDSAGRIAVSFANGATHRINVYTTTNSGSTVSSCAQYNPTGTAAIPIIAHSDGNFYVGTQSDDIIRRMTSAGVFTTVWAANTTIISDPVAMLELPNGNILVASDATDSIEQITTSGVRVGSQSFIRNAFSGGVTQMMLIRGQ